MAKSKLGMSSFDIDIKFKDKDEARKYEFTPKSCGRRQHILKGIRVKVLVIITII